MSLFLKAIRGEPCSRPPVWMMRQAGRYLPEYQAVRKNSDFLTMARTPELACKVSLQPIERFSLDACVFFSDILTPLVPMGMDLVFAEGEGPKLSPPLRSDEDVAKLKAIDPYKEVSFVPDTLKKLREQLPETVALIGFAGAPFTLASYMIEGGGSKHFVELHKMIYNHPNGFKLLMEKLTEMLVEYLKMQVEAGAQALQLFDTWGGMLSLEEYHIHSLPYLQQIFSALKPLNVPLILYINNGHHLLPAYLKSGADVASIDWRISLKEARDYFKENMAIQGNLNPLLLFGPTSEVQKQTRKLLDEIRSPAGYTRFVFNLGHGILPKTPIESVSAMLDVIHEAKA